MVKQGDVVDVLLAPKKGRLALRVGDSHVELSLPEHVASQPLALAVGLKYAGDAVRICCIERGAVDASGWAGA